ncbi:MAG: NAD(P)/FAD-dependent oxidoreductase [Thermodesulfobacteriota bacterium]
MVIIGNSASAVGAIEAIRKREPILPITVISDEPHAVYSRPLISYLLAGEIKPEQLAYRPKNFYEKNLVQAFLGRRVVRVDFNKKSVQLEEGKEVSYDRLLISTGGKPFLPKIDGLHLPGVYTFTKLEDAQKILSILKEVQRTIVIGGGLIGLKTAEALRKRNLEVTLVELAKHILSLTMDETASSILEKELKKEGIQLITSNTVESIEGKNRVESVRLSDGKVIKAQLVVVAIGVVPNVDLFKETRLHIEKGIRVNDRMETNIQGVYAAGDVVEAYDKVTKGYRTNPIWPNAYLQGKVAGNQMAGNSDYRYEGGFMMNSIEVAHIPTISLGLVNPPSKDGYQMIRRLDRRVNSYRKIVLKDDVIVGALFVGDIDRAGIITGLIREGIKVKGFKRQFLNESFGLVSFPKELRKERLLNLK